MYEFDTSRRPLLIVRMRDNVSVDELAQMKADIDRLIDQAQPFALIWDIVDTAIPPRPVIMDLLEWNRAARARFSQVYEQGSSRIPTFTAYHMPSMLGNLLRFFLQMVPSVRSQHLVCASFEDAVAASEHALAIMEFERVPSRTGS